MSQKRRFVHFSLNDFRSVNAVCRRISLNFTLWDQIDLKCKFAQVFLLLLPFLVSEVKTDEQNRFIQTFPATFLFQFLARVAIKYRKFTGVESYFTSIPEFGLLTHFLSKIHQDFWTNLIQPHIGSLRIEMTIAKNYSLENEVNLS